MTSNFHVKLWKVDTTDWEVALVKLLSTANLSDIPPEHRRITISFKSDLSTARFFHVDITQAGACVSPVRLITAVHKAVSDILKPFPDVPLPRI